MAISASKSATVRFRNEMDCLMNYMDLDNAGLAKLLGCSLPTICNMRSDPLSVSGKYILMVQEYLRRERKKYEEY